MTAGDWSAIAAVVAAVATAIVAVITGIVDRRSAAGSPRRTAARARDRLGSCSSGRRRSVSRSTLARGGHTDPVIRKDMGAEALALIALLGPEPDPKLWADRVGKSDEELRAFVADESNAEFLRNAVEAERAMNGIAPELRAEHPQRA